MSSGSDELRTTALNGWHRASGARMVDFAGWEMPLEYPSGTVTEHRAVRSGCGAFDVSHMGTLDVVGAGAVAALNDLLTNDLTTLADGDVQYTLLCDDAGGVVDDMLATRIAADHIMIVPNASNTEAVVGIVREVVGADALTDRSADTAILAVQGPGADAAVSGLGLPVGHPYMSIATGSVAGVDAIVSRTGYTGERGYELILPGRAAMSVWEDLMDSGAVTPCGLGARDTLRTEMGYALHGQDISAAIGPVAAGLSWAVAWDKPRFAGRGVLLAQRADGVPRRLRGIRLEQRGVLRPGMSVVADGAGIGTLTSGTFSPSLKQGIGLALVDATFGPGDQVAVDIRGRQVPATLVRPPFVPSSPK